MSDEQSNGEGGTLVPPAQPRPGDAAKSPDGDGKTGRLSREARLAQALRANLRRRKAARVKD